MLKKFAVYASLFFVSVCYSILGSAEQNTRVLILGDSLSAGYGLEYGQNWVDMLSQRFSQQGETIQFINDSISGDTTASGLARLPRALNQYQPNWVVLELGANDGLRGLSLSAMRDNLENMVELSLQNGAQVALVGMDIPKNYGITFRRAFKQVYSDVADKYELPFLQGEQFESIIGNPSYLQQDGLHPNQQAQPLIQEIMFVFLQPLLSDEA